MNELIYTGKRWINLANVVEIEDNGSSILISFSAWRDHPTDPNATVRDGRLIDDVDELRELRAALQAR